MIEKDEWEKPIILERICAADIDEIATLLNLMAYDLTRPRGGLLRRAPSMPKMMMEPGRVVRL